MEAHPRGKEEQKEIREGIVEAGKKLETVKVPPSSHEVTVSETVKIGNFHVAFFLEQLQYYKVLEYMDEHI